MEGAHGELRARLADRLRGDDAHRLADIDHACRARDRGRSTCRRRRPASRRSAPSGSAPPRCRPARCCSTASSSISALPGDDAPRRSSGSTHVLRRGAAEDAFGRAATMTSPPSTTARTVRPRVGAAILLGDDAVLRHVDQAARQIARVGGLERGVGQALARAVRRVEVLEHGQAFLEVGDDRRLDDLARRLGHQAAHAGQLLDLRRRAARAGVRHHPHRVDRRAGLLAVRISFIISSATRRCSATRRRPPCCTSRPG